MRASDEMSRGTRSQVLAGLQKISLGRYQVVGIVELACGCRMRWGSWFVVNCAAANAYIMKCEERK